LAVLGDVGDTGLDSTATTRPGNVVTAESDGSRRDRSEAGESFDQFALAVSLHAGDTEDFALPDGEVHAADLFEAAVPSHPERIDFEDGVAGRRLPRLAVEQHVPSDHHPRQFLLGGLLGAHGADGLSVPENGDVVGDSQRLVQLVRDEDERATGRREFVHHVEQTPDLLGREDGGRFVEDEYLGPSVEALDDFDALASAEVEVPYRNVEIPVHVEVVARAYLLDVSAGGRLVYKSVFGWFVAQNDVLEDGHRFHQLEVLVNHPDARVHRVSGRVDVSDLAVYRYRPGVLFVQSVEDAHQRRLSRPVLAEESVDRAPLEREVDAVVRYDVAESLGDALESDGGCLCLTRSHSGGVSS